MRRIRIDVSRVLALRRGWLVIAEVVRTLTLRNSSVELYALLEWFEGGEVGCLEGVRLRLS